MVELQHTKDADATYLLAFSSEDRVAMIWGGSKNTTMELSVDFVLSMTGTSGGSGSGNKSEILMVNGGWHLVAIAGIIVLAASHFY